MSWLSFSGPTNKIRICCLMIFSFIVLWNIGTFTDFQICLSLRRERTYVPNFACGLCTTAKKWGETFFSLNSITTTSLTKEKNIPSSWTVIKSYTHLVQSANKHSDSPKNWSPYQSYTIRFRQTYFLLRFNDG